MPSNNSWQKVTFDQICKNISDRIDDPKQATTDYYVGLEHLDSEDPKITRHGSPQDVSKTKLLFKSGHILFGKRNWYLRRLAVAKRDGICSAHMLVLEPIEGKIIKEFVPLLMFSDDFYEKALMVSAGSMSPTIKWKDISKLEFLIPSISEQENILSITQKIDYAISNAQQLLEKTKNYMISKRESLLTRGIGHTKFKKVEWYFDKIIEIPEEWNIVKLLDLLKIRYGLSQPPKFDNNGIPMIRATDIKLGKIILDKPIKIDPDSIPKSKTPFLYAGDIIVVRSGVFTGDVALITSEFDKSVCGYDIILYCNQKSDSPFLVYYLLSYLIQNYFRSLSTRSAQPHLNSEQIGNLNILLPSFKEQKQISVILSNLDNQVTQQQSHLSNLKVLRKSILNSKLTKEKIIVTN